MTTRPERINTIHRRAKKQGFKLLKTRRKPGDQVDLFIIYNEDETAIDRWAGDRYRVLDLDGVEDLLRNKNRYE